MMKRLEQLLEGVDIASFHGTALERPQLIFDGKTYSILEQRGEGSQGVVYHAQDTDGKDVALKMMHRIPTAEQIRSFAMYEKLHEVDCIPTLLAHGATNDRIFGRYILVTDYIDGMTLSQLLTRKRLNSDGVREFLDAALLGLQELHSYNVLHRDIKPSNIMIDKEGHLKYIDMGLVRSVHRETFSGTMGVGTGQYAAPEQIYGEPVPASDVYSLGVVCWQLLTGKEPPAPYHPLADARELKFDDLRNTVPAQLLAVVKKMCDKDVNKRYKSTGEVLGALGSLEERVEQTAMVVGKSGELPEVAKKEIQEYRNAVRNIRGKIVKEGFLLGTTDYVAAVFKRDGKTYILGERAEGSLRTAIFSAPLSLSLAFGPPLPISTPYGFSNNYKFARVYDLETGEMQERIVKRRWSFDTVLAAIATGGLYLTMPWVRRRKKALDEFNLLVEKYPDNGREVEEWLEKGVKYKRESVEKAKRELETEIAGLEKQIADFRWYKPALAFATAPLAFPFIFLVDGIAGAFGISGDDSYHPLTNKLKAPYYHFKAKKRLKEAKIELELFAEQNPEVRNLLRERKNVNNLNPWRGGIVHHAPSLMATATAVYTVYSGASTHQAIVSAGIAAGIYVVEKAYFGSSNRKDRKALDDKIIALRQQQLYVSDNTKEYILMETTRTYAEGVHALQKACIAEQNPLHPKYRLANGKEVYRQLNFKETFQAGVEDFWRLKDADGIERTFDERTTLLQSYRNSCTGMAYPRPARFFTIIPECEEWIVVSREFHAPSIPIEYADFRTKGIELDRKKAKYNTLLTPDEIDNHEAWLTALEGDTRLLKACREAVFAAYKQKHGRVLDRGMGFYLPNTPTHDELMVLVVSDLDNDFGAVGGNYLSDLGSFVRVVPSQKIFLKQN